MIFEMGYLVDGGSVERICLHFHQQLPADHEVNETEDLNIEIFIGTKNNPYRTQELHIMVRTLPTFRSFFKDQNGHRKFHS